MIAWADIVGFHNVSFRSPVKPQLTRLRPSKPAALETLDLWFRPLAHRFGSDKLF